MNKIFETNLCLGLHIVSCSFQSNENLASRCFICNKSTEEDSKLKPVDKPGPSLRNAAAIRTTLRSDKFEEVTKRIMSTDVDGKMYHQSCHRHYTAVKRPKSEVGSEPLPKMTRNSSALPQTERHGILKGLCIFYGKDRKKKGWREEKLTSVATVGGCDTLVERAPRSTNNHFKSLIMGDVDLIAKEIKYHKSCRVQFMHETEMAGPS